MRSTEIIQRYKVLPINTGCYGYQCVEQYNNRTIGPPCTVASQVMKNYYLKLKGIEKKLESLVRGDCTGSNWIVQKLIERDQINHHYRRLNTAQSQLQLNKRTLVASRNRLSKSSNDLRFEDQLRGVEDKIVNEFYLDVTPLVSDKRKEISDHSQDVMSRHSQYFTHPSKQFTPRTVRKIVRPQTTPPKRVSSAVVRPVTPIVSVRSNSAVQTPRKIQNRAVKAIAADPKRNVSDDSAFGDEHSTVESDSSNSSSDSLGTAEFNIKTWLKEQYGVRLLFHSNNLIIH